MVVSLSTGLGVWLAGLHDSMLSVRLLMVDRLTPRSDTEELSAELSTPMVSIRKETAPLTAHRWKKYIVWMELHTFQSIAVLEHCIRTFSFNNMHQPTISIERQDTNLPLAQLQHFNQFKCKKKRKKEKRRESYLPD